MPNEDKIFSSSLPSFRFDAVIAQCLQIHYNKQVVIKQNTVQSMIITVLYISHNDRFGHNLHQKPSRRGKQI